MSVTSLQIAETCKVSQATVSRILSGTASHSARTRRRVLAAADRLGYRVNAAARTTATGRFSTLALLLSEHSYYSHLPNALLRGVEAAATEADHRLSIARLADGEVTDETILPRVLREHSADGLLINYHFHVPGPMRDLINRYRIPAVWLNAKEPHDAVYPDDRGAGRMAARYLLERGFKRIAYVDFSHGQAELGIRHYSASDRAAGYEEAMRTAGHEPWVIRDPHRTVERPERYPMARSILESADRPDAFVTYAETTMLPLAIAGLKLELGLGSDKFPMVTFADDPMDFLGTPLPTFLVPNREVGESGVRMIMNRIASPQVPQASLAVAFSFTDKARKPPIV